MVSSDVACITFPSMITVTVRPSTVSRIRN